jgi:ABC-type dipeptide/oligopeptide/nickel transport system ATPase component
MPKVLELPPYNRHIVMVGSTGSGKSWLAESMLKYYDSYFAIDTQDSLEIPGHRIISPDHLPFMLQVFKKLHYVPKPELLERDVFNFVFKTLLDSSSKKKPHQRVIYIDEIYHVGYGTAFPNWLPKAITTARQRQLAFWISTQRPRQIPIPIFSEASKIYVFYLSKEDDCKLISSFARTNKKELFETLLNQQDDYSFIEINCRKGTWEKYPPLTRTKTK